MDRITFNGDNLEEVLVFLGQDYAARSGEAWTSSPDNIKIKKGDTFSKDGKVGDAVNPAHYGEGVYEVINVIEAWDLGFHLSNVLKYAYRAGKKDDELQDLLKAKWYLERKIKQLQ